MVDVTKILCGKQNHAVQNKVTVVLEIYTSIFKIMRIGQFWRL